MLEGDRAYEESCRRYVEKYGRKSAVQVRHRPKQMNTNDFGFKHSKLMDFFV